MGHTEELKFLKEQETQAERPHTFLRREFFKIMGVGSGMFITLGGWLVKDANAQGSPIYSWIVVDLNKCTGCRTCEAVCSQVNRKVTINGKPFDGLGNPHFSNIRIEYFNPPVDIPNHCFMCKDAPCIESCPVEPDEKTGRKALYRDEKTLAVKVDYESCISCGSCARTCTELRSGAILLNADTGKPEGICNLCEGDPTCVKKCPFGALSHMKKASLDGRLFAQAPEKVAEELMNLWYYHQR